MNKSITSSITSIRKNEHANGTTDGSVCYRVRLENDAILPQTFYTVRNAAHYAEFHHPGDDFSIIQETAPAVRPMARRHERRNAWVDVEPTPHTVSAGDAEATAQAVFGDALSEARAADERGMIYRSMMRCVQEQGGTIEEMRP